MNKILNLTQHVATPEQLAQGVIEPTPKDKHEIKSLLTFNTLPTKEEVNERAGKLAGIAETYEVTCAMLGGAPYLLSALELWLCWQGISPVHSFTERISSETLSEDGEVIKTSVFKHIGFVSP